MYLGIVFNYVVCVHSSVKYNQNRAATVCAESEASSRNSSNHCSLMIITELLSRLSVLAGVDSTGTGGT